MNKLKDFLYDHTDIILSLLVILVIIFIVGTNFTLFDQKLSSFSGLSETSNSANSELPEENSAAEESSLPEKTGQEPPVNNTDPENIEENNTVTITIPLGASASDVGEVLLNKDLINSTSEFIETTEALNVSHQLKPGEFEIPRDASLEDMIQILIQSSL